MKTTKATRRSVLKSMLAAGAAPWIVPAHVLGKAAGTPPSSKLTLGVIGVGAQGQGDMRDFMTNEGVRVTAICDVNRRNIDTARQHIAAAYGKPDVKAFADFRELNADPSLDAVLMALPVHWHSVPALDAILHGKHIYHEKPMAMSFEEARRVREAVRRKKVVFQFGTQQRSDMKFRWACELALNGRLGKLKEIHVSAPGGGQRPPFPEQSVPDYVNWDHWVGPAPMTPFHEEKLMRNNHENISNFSLGMISCWGIHHLDIAQWGNGTDNRGVIEASDERLLRDPQNKHDTMPIKLPVSNRHTYDFVDAIRSGTRAICDIETAVRSDTLCQLALIAVKQGRKLQWDPKVECFVDDDAATKMLQPRAFRGPWRLPDV